MRVTFPHLGKLYVFWRALFEGFRIEAVPPPFSSQRTLDLGVRHCPEMTCAPCKRIFGNYVEALEQGADAILFFGGHDACRLGYSMPWQAQLLREMGYEFQGYSFNLRALREDLVAHNVLRGLQRDVPILSLSFDEQTGRAGLVTRLEAFADMLHMRAGKRE